MPCDALVCKREDSCRDLSCPGHPKGVAAYLDEMDRQSVAHHKAMNKKLAGGGYWPREQAADDTAQQAKPRQLHWPDYAAIAVVVSFFAYAIAHSLGVL